MSPEQSLAGQLIEFDSSTEEGISRCAGFVRGWFEAQGIAVQQLECRGLPVLVVDVGPQHGPTVLLHGHLDVVPGHDHQFQARTEDDRLFGRGAYDMKGALAAMMLAVVELRDESRVRVRFGIVPDEETEEEADRATDRLLAEGFRGDFAITGEPTDMHIGVEAKGVLAVGLRVSGRSAHGSTPWLGDNAILKALDVFRGIESLPFARESSELFDRPSINLGRIHGGDALNKVPDSCVIDVDIRYLPEQDPEQILEAVNQLPDTEVVSTFSRPPASVDRRSPFVQGLCRAAAPAYDGEVLSVGRDGASEAVAFLREGIPAVEFGPVGGGHHGPGEWVSISSLAAYRDALTRFVRTLPEEVGEEAR